MLRFTAEISFTDLPDLPEKASRTVTSQGVYRTLDKSLCPGVMEPRIYYESFVVPQPDGIVYEYTRDYILGKLRLLAGEWMRRHLFCMEFYPPGVPPPEEEVLCCDACPLHQTSGRHAKTDEETAWEQIAADGFNSFARLLNRLDELESQGQVITGYSSMTEQDFSADKVPSSIFDLPSLPEPIDPPGDRVDAGMIPEEKVYLLSNDYDEFHDLLNFRKIHRPFVSQPQGFSLRALSNRFFGLG